MINDAAKSVLRFTGPGYLIIMYSQFWFLSTNFNVLIFHLIEAKNSSASLFSSPMIKNGQTNHGFDLFAIILFYFDFWHSLNMITKQLVCISRLQYFPNHNQMLVGLRWKCNFLQVFGELIENCQSDAQQNSVQRGSSDLKEHMVGILFSRRKLNNLQKQVSPFFTQVLFSDLYIVYPVMWGGILHVKELFGFLW